MKKVKIFIKISFVFGIIFLMSSCSITNQSMKMPNHYIEFYKADFEYSKQVTAEATSVRILGIDWARLFKWESGEIEGEVQNKVNINTSAFLSDLELIDNLTGGLATSIPVIGNYAKGKISSYALYNLMQENPGYDIVIYPQYEVKRFIVPVFYSKRTAKVTARLGKIK